MLRMLAWTLVLVACVAWTIGGCRQAGDTKEATSGKPAKKLTIGVSIPSADHGWTGGVVWWAKRAMEMHPEVDWVFATAGTSEKQIADIKDMMAQRKLDGLVVLANESAPLTPIAEEAHKNGIYLVNVDRGFLKPVANLFIEGDNEAFGRKAAQYIADKLGGKGNVVILEGVACTVNTSRVNGAMSVFKKYPDIKILGQQPADWNRDKALTVTQNFLTQHKKIDAVWAADDDMALGAEKAIREAGRAGEMFVIGGGGMKDVVKKIMDKDPMYPATITYPPSMIAVGIHMAVSNLRDDQAGKVNQFMPRHITLDVELVTPDNAKDYYFPESIY